MSVSEPAGRPIAVSIRDLHKSFGSNEVLKGISMEAREGAVVSILGSSGFGKSTMLRCINMLESPSSGEVIIAGEPIRMQKDRKGTNPDGSLDGFEIELYKVLCAHMKVTCTLTMQTFDGMIPALNAGKARGGYSLLRLLRLDGADLRHPERERAGEARPLRQGLLAVVG